VVFFHFNFSFVGKGELGVDVFFVISGYLITKQLMSGKYSILGFYRNRVMRLLPAFLATVLLVIFFFLIFFGESEIIAISKGLFAANTLSINYYLLNNSVNYFSAESFSLPISHFWSLAVEEHFYILWPVLVVFWLSIAKLSTYLRKSIFMVIITVMLILSFLYASRHQAQPWYYFDTLGRVWELFLGAGLAFALSSVSLINKSFAKLTRIRFSVLFLLSLTFIALALYLDTLSSLTSRVLVNIGSLGLILLSEIFYKIRKTKNFIGNVTTFFIFIGGLSYSLYLVHWPIYIFMVNILGKKPDITFSIIGIIISFFFAYIINKTVEINLRYNKKKATLVIVIISWLILTLRLYILGTTNSSTRDLKDNSITELSLEIENASMENYLPGKVSPELVILEGEKFIQDGSRDKCPKNVMACTLPSKFNKDSIVIYGDSHAIMWWPALYKAAMKHNYNAYLVAKGGCAPVVKVELANLLNPVDGPGIVKGCNEFKPLAYKAIKDIKPNLLLVTGAQQTGQWVAKLPASLTELKTLSPKVGYIGDFYYPREDILNCYAKANDGEKTWQSCGSKLEDINKFSDERAQEERISKELKVDFLDIKSLICSPSFCPAVIKNSLVYLDRNHISNTYSRAIFASFWELLQMPEGRVG